VKLPLIQKIEIEVSTPQDIENILKKNYVGQLPTLFILTPPKGVSLEKQYIALESAFQKLGIDPNFPYPTYITYETNLDQNFFPSLKGVEDAPKHFVKRIKRLKNREQALLNKANTLSSRIQNHSVSSDLNYISEKRRVNRALRDQCSERTFYEEVLAEIMDPQLESN